MHRKYALKICIPERCCSCWSTTAVYLAASCSKVYDVVTSMQTKCSSERLQKFLTRLKQTARDAHVQDLHHRRHMHVFAGRFIFLQ
jgi:hypothetical protein